MRFTKCLMVCYIIGIISGVPLTERASCPNKWAHMMSVFHFYQRLVQVAVHCLHTHFSSLNAEHNNEVKAITTSCNI